MPVEGDVPHSKTVELSRLGTATVSGAMPKREAAPLLAVSDLGNGSNQLLILDIMRPIRAVSIRAGLGRACCPGCARAV